METTMAGQLVKVATGGPEIDGIVFDVPSHKKVVVAVVDPGHGPVFRSVKPDALSEREEEGADDHALHALIRRTPPPVHGGARAGAGPVSARSGHSRASMHRTTGK
jgi:hypothetical protein